MPPLEPLAVRVISSRFLSEQERIQIADLASRGHGPTVIGKVLGRSPSTISRELRRNLHTSGQYRPFHAHAVSAAPRRRTHPLKLRTDRVLRAFVVERLRERWSPQQISPALRLAHPDDPARRLATETIYQAIYRPGSGIVRKPAPSPLRTGRDHRRGHSRQIRAGRRFAQPMLSVHQRGFEPTDRSEAGHWEGDLIVGPHNRSATSPSRQRKAKVVLGAMLDMALRHDALAVNPVRQTSRLRRPSTETRALTLEEIKRLRASLRDSMSEERPGPKESPDLSDVFELMLGTGARIGELLAVRWGDVDLDSPRPTLAITGTIKTERDRGTYRKPSPKTDASVRTVALPAFAVATLRRRRSAEPKNPLDAVFATRNDTWQQVNNIERRWRKVRASAALDWVTPHIFRKTVATLISERVNADTASQQLGHSSPAITREFYIAKPAIAADVEHVLQELADES